MEISAPFYGAMTGAPRGSGPRRVEASPYVDGPPVLAGPEESLGGLPPATETDFTPKVDRVYEENFQPKSSVDGAPPGYWDDFYREAEMSGLEPEMDMTPKSAPTPVLKPKPIVMDPEPWIPSSKPMKMVKPPGKPATAVYWDPKLKGGMGGYSGPYADLPSLGSPTTSSGGTGIGIPWGEAPPGGVKAW